MKFVRLLTFVLLLFPALAFAQQKSGKKSFAHKPVPSEQAAHKRALNPSLVIPFSSRLRIPLEFPELTAVLPTPTPTPKSAANGGTDVTPGAGVVSLPVAQTVALEGESQSGNVVVNVTENGNKVVKLGLAPRGVAVLDFPADDPVYKIYPGDENFVTVDCLARQDGKCANAPTDAIVLRPGKSFHSLGTEESAATVVTIQRRSGIVVSFVVVPVKNIAENANYVVVRYDLKQVLEARQKAGLAVNLLPGSTVLPAAAQQQPQPAGDAALSPRPPKSAVDADSGAQIISASLNSADYTSLPTTQPATGVEISGQVIAALNKAASRADLRFSKPAQGISLAPALIGERTGDITIDVVAVRNVLPHSIRLVPEQPELVVENRDKAESGVNIQRLAILHTATTVEADDVLQPGQVYYFAFAYTSPILGVKQALRVSFSHRSAADAPATLDLGISAR